MQFLKEPQPLQVGRLKLCNVIRWIIKTGIGLLDVSFFLHWHQCCGREEHPSINTSRALPDHYTGVIRYAHRCFQIALLNKTLWQDRNPLSKRLYAIGQGITNGVKAVGDWIEDHPYISGGVMIVAGVGLMFTGVGVSWSSSKPLIGVLK